MRSIKNQLKEELTRSPGSGMERFREQQVPKAGRNEKIKIY